MPKASEVAILEVNGTQYQDWETVQVHHNKLTQPFVTCRFTCSEAQPVSANFGAMQIKPGDICSVTLAGQPALQGTVFSRQAFYDAKRHYVEIQAASNVMPLAYTAAISQTGEHKNVNYEQYAKALLKPFSPPINLVVQGGKLPTTIFPRISIPHGMSVLEALELPLRSIGGFPLMSNANGDLVIGVGAADGVDTVVEGKNILEGREVIYNQGLASGHNTVAQGAGTDDSHGAEVAHKPYLATKFTGIGAEGQYNAAVMPLDMPTGSNAHLQGRADTERDMMALDSVTVYATVQGWLRPSGGLWKCDQVVHVVSPMLIMKGAEELRAKSISFTQDNERGSRTLLELCNPAAMGGGTPQETGGGSS